MTILNINIPKTDTATFQPGFSKTAEFPGFTLYHSLKERYIIRGENDVTSTFEPLLDEMDLPGGFAYLIGNNTNNVYIGQCESAIIAKVQYNPVTGDVISEDRIDVGDIARTELTAPGAEVFLTCGAVYGNRIILGICANTTSSAVMDPYLLISENNATTWTIYSFEDLPGQSPVPPEGLPSAVVRINFFDNFYYAVLIRQQQTDAYLLYVLDEASVETLPLGSLPFLYIQTIGGAGFPTSTQFSINKDIIWDYNSIRFLSDDRQSLVTLTSNLESGQWNNYPNSLPLESFDSFTESVDGAPNTRATFIDNMERASDYEGQFLPFMIATGVSEVMTAGTFGSLTVTGATKAIMWSEFNSGETDYDNMYISNFQPYEDDTLVLWRTDGGTDLNISRGQVFNTNTFETLDLTQVPLTRFNSFANDFWGLEDAVSEPLPAGWLANDTNSVWLSDRPDTNTHDYGTLGQDYLLTLDIDIPIAATVSFRAQYYGEITDIQIEGVAQGLSYSGNEGAWETINLTLPRGPSTITFEMRQLPAAGPGNPTGLRVEFNTLLDLGTFGDSQESDILVQETDDKFYVVYTTFAWKCTLSTFTIDYCVDLHAEPLVFVPPYPPGYDPFVITGVTDGTHVPVSWKLLENFGDIYCYNRYHDTSFTSTSNKEFYNWRFDDTDPSGHRMFAAFDLPITDITKLEYFYDLNGELFILICVNNANVYSTRQYRLNGLGQFNQVTTSPVFVGPIVFNTVTVDDRGVVFVTEDDTQNGYTLQPSTLFVYEVQDPGDIENSSYLIPVDENSSAFDFEGIDVINGLDYLGRRGKYFYLPGDYRCQGIVGSDLFRDELNTDLDENYANQSYEGVGHSGNPLLGAAGDVWYDAKTFGNWTYFLINTDRIVRARAVYYPQLSTFGGG